MNFITNFTDILLQSLGMINIITAIAMTAAFIFIVVVVVVGGDGGGGNGGIFGCRTD